MELELELELGPELESALEPEPEPKVADAEALMVEEEPEPESNGGVVVVVGKGLDCFEVDVGDVPPSVSVPPPLPSQTSPSGQQPLGIQNWPFGQYVEEPSLQQTAPIGMQFCSQVALPSELQDPDPGAPESEDVVGVEGLVEVGERV